MAEPVRSRLTAEGFGTLVSLAHAMTIPLSHPLLSAFLGLTPLLELRLSYAAPFIIHEACALTLAQIKHSIEGHSDDHSPPKLSPAEREPRRESQKAHLDQVNEFIEQNELKYDPWCYYNSHDGE
eukprot:4995047-Amphidinium_carterae.1